MSLALVTKGLLGMVQEVTFIEFGIIRVTPSAKQDPNINVSIDHQLTVDVDVDDGG